MRPCAAFVAVTQAILPVGSAIRSDARHRVLRYDAKLAGQEICDRHSRGDTTHTWMGRFGVFMGRRPTG